jgi:diaminopimelate decarboxylase
VSDFFQRPPGFVYCKLDKKKSEPGKLPPANGSRSSARSADRSLCAEQVPLDELTARYGTPLYVYSATAIRERAEAFQRAFDSFDHAICYSVKANSNLSILRLLAKLGCGFDVVSGGELERVLRAHRRSAKNVVFSGVGKTEAEMQSALRAGILLFNLESASELNLLAKCAAKLRCTAQVAFRVNPDVPADTHPYISTGLRKHKFGVPISEARKLCAAAAKLENVQVAGVSVHIGSQITDDAPFSAAMQRVATLVKQLRQDGHNINFVDAGGGLGIYYRNGSDDFEKLLRAYANALMKPLRNLHVKLLLEPGRSIVGPAGVLLTRVLYRKTNGNKKFVIVDAAMNDLIRPSLYQAEHEIVPVRLLGSKTENVDIVGPICESGDFFARDRDLSAVDEGDLLAILDVGAYGMPLASNYNSRPRPAEVLVERKSVKLIRERETMKDLLRAELSALR